MPSAFKEALVIPLLKKPNADIELKIFRPISNLPFLSKVLERIVIDQMSAHCDKHRLNEKMQSAYRRGHSTETALLKVCNDIFITSINNKLLRWRCWILAQPSIPYAIPYFSIAYPQTSVLKGRH